MEVKEENLSSIAVKNSAFALIYAIISKIGGAIFVILIARLLLPELFGVYSLAISIIVIILAFTDLGISDTVVRYVSQALGKGKTGKARTYIRYLFKLKLFLLLIFVSIILIFSKFIAYNIYDNPLLFFPLLFSFLYIIVESFKSFLGGLFLAIKNLKPMPPLEFLYQFLKIFFSIIAISLLSDKFKIAGVLVASAFAGAIIIALMILWLIKKNKKLFFGETKKIEKTKILNYLKFMSITSISLVFFGSIDILMLGGFVDSIYLGYYRAALGLIITISAVLSFSGILLPIFTQIDGKRFRRGFQETFRYIMMLTLPSFFGLVFLSKYLIFTLYGAEYLPSTSSLYILSLLVIIAPLVALYSTVFQSKAKVKTLANSIYFSLILNVILNWILISTFLKVSQEYAIVGAGIATVVSRAFLLLSLKVKATSQMKLTVRGKDIFKPLIASLIMAAFLIFYNQKIEINVFSGIIEIILGAMIYFISLWVVKGIKVEDLKLLKLIIK